jgi:gp16 family phage-associated protein
MKAKTPEQIKSELINNGITVSQWSRDHDFNPREVSRVLNGQIKGHHGKSHQIAVALGLKVPSQQAAA